MESQGRALRLLGRASFGPRPGDLEHLRGLGAEAWLADQLTPGADPGLAGRLAAFPSLGLDPGESLEGMVSMDMDPRSRLRDRDEGLSEEARRELKERSVEIGREVVGARVVRAVHGAWGLREVMIDFWSNHFSIYARKNLVAPLLPHYQREVLEPHALGRFEDLLLAVAKSPAMLLYLDNWSSTAPQPAPRRRRLREVRLPGRGKGGINENYARELLELHTLGVDGGYTQDDVQEVARVLTGWSLESRRRPVFHFWNRLHDPGSKLVLGERTSGEGQEEGERLLRRLARHPATARHIAGKLAQRFVADEPPAPLVARAARRFLETEGEIREVLRVILLSPELGDPAQRKLKTPLRFAASALRASGGETDGSRRALFALTRLGELPFMARTPAGYPEKSRYWIDPGAMLERMNFAFALARGDLRGTQLGPTLPGRAGGAGSTHDPVPGASREHVALVLASPEFQWT